VAQEKIEAGQATSIRDAARQMAEETGETPAAVDQKIRRGMKEVRQVVAPQQPAETTAETPELEKLEKPTHGGARPGAGRKNRLGTLLIQRATHAQDHCKQM
jgi:hypothetical protein